MLSRELFGETFAGLCAMYDKEVSKILADMYYTNIQDLTDEQFKSAVNHFISTNTYFRIPSVAEIRQAVLGNPDDKAQIAISKIETAMQKFGTYHSVKFDDPIIHAVIISHGGWVKLCEVTEDDWQFLKKDFIKSYKAFSNTHPAHLDIPEVLEGIHGLESNKAMLATIGKEVEVKFISTNQSQKVLEGRLNGQTNKP